MGGRVHHVGGSVGYWETVVRVLGLCLRWIGFVKGGCFSCSRCH